MKKYALTLCLAVAIFAACTLLFAQLVRAGSTTALATLNNQPITEDEVMQKANKRMMKILSETYEIKRQVIDEIIDDRLLEAEAKKQGSSKEAMIDKARRAALDPSEAEIKAIYDMQKERVFKGKEFETVKDDIKKQLKNQKERTAVMDFLDGLRKTAAVKVNLERPSVAITVDDDPTQGPATAPITLIEFSEFQCPFCKRARPTIKKVLDTYGDKIRYAFRDFPLSFHKNARGASIAANCAHEQGKYWEYNAKLFENQEKIGDDLYKQLAKDLALDIAKFDTCTADTAKHDKEIEHDQEEGSEVGVTGTPAYFINGHFLSGAQPFAAFKEIIDEELAKKGIK